MAMTAGGSRGFDARVAHPGAILHYIPDTGEAQRIVARLVSALAPGSYLTISHAASDISAEEMAEMNLPRRWWRGSGTASSGNLLAPAAGQRFTMTGQVVRAGRALVVCRGEAFADGTDRPFAAMQATMTALYDRPGISG
jgi:S-adenosyl methyltransferase